MLGFEWIFAKVLSSKACEYIKMVMVDVSDKHHIEDQATDTNSWDNEIWESYEHVDPV